MHQIVSQPNKSHTLVKQMNQPRRWTWPSVSGCKETHTPVDTIVVAYLWVAGNSICIHASVHPCLAFMSSCMFANVDIWMDIWNCNNENAPAWVWGGAEGTTHKYPRVNTEHAAIWTASEGINGRANTKPKAQIIQIAKPLK